MNDVTIIDRFLDTFSRYIDSGFGLLQGEMAFLTATLIAIDMTIAGLYWALGHASGQGDDVIAKLLRKVLYIGAFAYIINNFNWLSGIVFKSFAGLGLTATGSTLSMENFLQPGRLAKTGIDAGAPILEQIGDMAGFPEVFVNVDAIIVMFVAWLIVVLCFFVLAIQLFITLIEFKLTTLAGFVLVPFVLWNKTSFLAEKVLGNVVSAGIKVLVLAVIVGIGSGLLAEFQVQPDEPSIVAFFIGIGNLRAGDCNGSGIRCAATWRGRNGRSRRCCWCCCNGGRCSGNRRGQFDCGRRKGGNLNGEWCQVGIQSRFRCRWWRRKRRNGGIRQCCQDRRTGSRAESRWCFAPEWFGRCVRRRF